MLRARDLMQRDPVKIAPHAPFLEIQRLFVVGQISGAPVVDERGTVLGVVSGTDLLRVVDQVCDDELDPTPSTADGAPMSEELPERLGSLTALDVLSPDVVWVSPDTPITDVAQLMRTEGIHRVLVGDEGRLVGILTTFDLLNAVKG